MSYPRAITLHQQICPRVIAPPPKMISTGDHPLDIAFVHGSSPPCDTGNHHPHQLDSQLFITISFYLGAGHAFTVPSHPQEIRPKSRARLQSGLACHPRSVARTRSDRLRHAPLGAYLLGRKKGLRSFICTHDHHQNFRRSDMSKWLDDIHMMYVDTNSLEHRRFWRRQRIKWLAQRALHYVVSHAIAAIIVLLASIMLAALLFPILAHIVRESSFLGYSLSAWLLPLATLLFITFTNSLACSIREKLFRE